METNYMTIFSNKKKVVLNTNTILYVIMMKNDAYIHVLGNAVYKTRMTFKEVEKKLSDSFIKIHRGCVVSVMAIHNITDTINLSNGETLAYTLRKKKQIIEQFHDKQKRIINSFRNTGVPVTDDDYRNYYMSFENQPFAFADIEMIFNEKKQAVDWIFRYCNPSCAKLEKLPVEKLMGSSFGSLFSNMDSKWLRSYERAALYGEMIEIADYSPEIDAYLKVICFPTFKGHCGCILFDISQLKFFKNA